MADTQFSPKPFNASNIHGGLKFPDTKSPLLPSDVNNIVEMLYGVSNSASYAASVANITSSNGAEIKFDTSNKTITFEQGLRFFSKKFDYTVENDRILTITQENQHYVVMFNTEDNTISSTPLNNYRDSQYSSDKYAYLLAVYFDGNEVYTDLKFPYNKIQKIKDDVEEIKDDVEEIKDDVEEIKDDVEEIKDDVEEIKVLVDLKEGTEGLAFADNGDGTCSVVGIGTATDTDIVIPIFHNNNKVTSIGSNAFEFCNSLTSITIPEGVQEIRTGAFLGCSNLQTITFSENSQLTSIGSNAFVGCSSLTSINIPSSVQEIGERAFYNCPSLQKVTFFENGQLSTIGKQAFSYCDSLTSITIPNTATSIGKYAFTSCQSLKIFFIPKSVTTISGSLFSSSPELTIYTEWEFKPDGWSDDFNYDSIPVIWGVDLKENLTEVSVDIHELSADITELNEKVDSLESEQQASVVNITSIDEVYENKEALPTTGVENGTTYLVANASVQELYSYNSITSEWVKKGDLKSNTLYPVLTGEKKGIYRYTMSYPYLVSAEQDATNAFKNTVSGATVKIEDISPFTHTMPVKLKSKNILAYPYYHGATRVSAGITFTQNADQSITMNGTATANATYFAYTGAYPFEVGTYYIGAFSGEKNNNVRFVVEWYSDTNYVGGITANAGATPSKLTVTANNYTKVNILIQVLSGTTLSGFTVYPMICKGTSPTKHTPYISDFSGLTLKRYGETENDFLRTYTAESDGTIKGGVTSLYPIVNLVPDSDSVEVEVEYNKDINKALQEYVPILTTTDGDRVYVAKAGGGTGLIQIQYGSPIAWTLPGRIEGGIVRVGTPKGDTDATNKKFVVDGFAPKLTTTEVYWSTVEAAGEYIVTDGEYAFGFGDEDTPSKGQLRFSGIFDSVSWKGGKPDYITESGYNSENGYYDGVILKFSDAVKYETVILKFRELPCLYGSVRLLIEVI